MSGRSATLAEVALDDENCELKRVGNGEMRGKKIVLRENSMIGRVLDNPRMSEWVKAAIRTAEGCDWADLQNDLEILRVLIQSEMAADMAGSG